MNRIVYCSRNKQYYIEINENIINEMILECEKATNYETGGILVGKYSDDLRCAKINSICKAPTDSKRGRTSFMRGVRGLIEALNKKWEESNEYYLGEWHFHPNFSSIPSKTDKIQMKNLARDRNLKCPEPILLVIGGNSISGWNISFNLFLENDMIELFKYHD